MQTLSTIRKIPIKKENDFTQYLGMVITIGSLSMLFTTLLVSYGILRVRSDVWNAQIIDTFPLLLLFINTGVILFSSYTYFKGNKAVVIHNRFITRKWINTTILIGLIFLIIQLYLWTILNNSGYFITTSQGTAILYLLTGLHGLHILGGIIALFWVSHQLAKRTNFVIPVKLVGMFWHFLTIVWIVIFTTLIII
tara:strand:+ start:653 stop:1237 length:585 start_codon:yes stop_codon:yes gene_type:complete